jgi:FdhD protein
MVPAGASAVRHSVVKVVGHRALECQDHLAVEEPLEIRLGGMSLAVTMRTPGDDEELVAGFLFSERVISTADDLDVIARYRAPEGDPDSGNVMNVLLKGDPRVARELLRRNFVASSSCGLCGKVTIDAIRATLAPVETDVMVPRDLFPRLAQVMGEAQPTFEKTGGLHAAGLFDADGRLLVLREDIGRHNAVDKVIGHMVLTRQHPLDRQILMVSGPRQLRDHAEGADGEDPRGRGRVGSVQPGRADGHRRRHDAGGLRAARRLQYLRGAPSASRRAPVSLRDGPRWAPR